jgi:hypothetical protein
VDTREATQQYRMNKWTELISECRSSGQTVAKWCSDHNISEKSYYYWLKRIRTAACEALPSLNTGNNPIVPVSIPLNAEDTSSTCQGTTPGVVIRIGEATVEVYRNASQDVIEKAIRSIQNAR